MIKKLFNTYRENEDGVAIIEGILILPIAILLFVGIFEVGQMLLLNQKVYAASHMVGDLLTRKSTLDNDDLDEAFAAGKMILEPFEPEDLVLDIVGVQFDPSSAPETLWQKSFPSSAADSALYQRAEGLGSENEGAIVVKATYTYNPVFLNFKMPFTSGASNFSILEMNEVSVLRGRVNSCLSYDDNGTLYTC